MEVLNQTFKLKFDRSHFDEDVPLLALFMTKYKVPLILRWNYQVEAKEVYRQRMVKWWDKFDHQKIIEVVLHDFPIAAAQGPAIAAQTAQALPATQPSKALPQDQDPHNIQSLSDISPSPSLKGAASSSEPKSSSKKKQNRLDLAQQLLAEAALLQQDDSDSGNSSDASSQPITNWANEVYRDSQDPFSL